MVNPKDKPAGSKQGLRVHRSAGPLRLVRTCDNSARTSSSIIKLLKEFEHRNAI